MGVAGCEGGCACFGGEPSITVWLRLCLFFATACDKATLPFCHGLDTDFQLFIDFYLF